jgi:glycosyltransferase involved in cell wall biosynthesis
VPGYEGSATTGVSDLPQVSVILATRDRPRFLRLALACYRHQTYPRRELIVIDDGDAFPADPDGVAAGGGRLIRVEPGTPLGTKLNLGLEAARGRLCQKMDDDDWYAPRFLETMVRSVLASWRVVCRPTLAFLRPFLFFDLARWEVRRSTDFHAPGSTFLFGPDDWEGRRFRAVRRNDDTWFLSDQARAGVATLPVHAPELFLAVRHRGAGLGRAHTWTHLGGRMLEEHLARRPLCEGGPEAILPGWALAAYRELRRDLSSSGATAASQPLGARAT